MVFVLLSLNEVSETILYFMDAVFLRFNRRTSLSASDIVSKTKMTYNLNDAVVFAKLIPQINWNPFFFETAITLSGS